MKTFDWSREKNAWLRTERGLTFEQGVFQVSRGGLLDVLEHPDPKAYPGQRLMVVEIEGYAHVVPFVEEEDTIFLKTVFPSRKMTKRYLGKDLS